MRVIIAGSRSLCDDGKFECSASKSGVPLVERAVRASGFTITFLLTGGAIGIDTAAVLWAWQRNLTSGLIIPANFSKWGKRAGIYRNTDLVIRAEALIAIWDGQTPGTANVMAQAANAKLKTFCLRVGRDWT